MNLLLVGHGNMGSALLSRWKETRAAGIANFYIVDPARNENTLPEHTIPDVIVFAVKPQSLTEILPEYKKRFGTAPLYLSIAAGKTLSFFAQHLGDDAKIIRAMPNTPALVGKAMTGLCASSTVSDAQKQIASSLMQAAGKIVWVEEAQMDAVTALSGSGPAYVFLFLDALAHAGMAAGLDEAQANMLALETVHGSLHLAAKSPDSFAQLRKNVTSPGGTTEAALNILMKNGALEQLVQQAVLAASARAKELEK